MGQLAIAAQWT